MSEAKQEEKFLDYLVIEVVEEISVKEVSTRGGQKTKPQVFLTVLGVETIQDYIQRTLEAKLGGDAIPNGDLYVVTPESYFRYQKNDSHFSTSTTDFYGFGSFGALGDLSKILERLVADNKKEKKDTSLNVLFFDEASKVNFEQKVGTKSLQLKGTRDININDYGTVKLYTYSAAKQITIPI